MEQEQNTQKKTFPEDKELPPQVLQFTFDLKQQQIQTSVLFIGLHGLGSLYLHGKTQNQSELIGTLNFEKNKQRGLADIYMLKNKEIVIIFNETLRNNLDYNFSDALFKQIIPQKVVVLDWKLQCTLENLNEQTKSKGLRVINSSLSKMSNSLQVADQLEVGNDVKGVGADLLIFCEMNGLQCDVFIGIAEYEEYNIQSLNVYKPLEPLFVPFREKWNEKEVKNLIRNYNKSLATNNIYL